MLATKKRIAAADIITTKKRIAAANIITTRVSAAAVMNTKKIAVTTVAAATNKQGPSGPFFDFVFNILVFKMKNGKSVLC